MTNREFFKEQILDIACSGNRVAIDKDGKLCACDYHFACKNCMLLGSALACKDNFKEWANSEYVEPCLFEKDELVEVSNNKETWHLRYFYGSCDGKFMTFYNGKTSKETDLTTTWEYCRKYGTLGGLVKEETANEQSAK